MTSQRFLCSLREFLTDQIEKRTKRRSLRKKRRDVPEVMQFLEKRMLLTTNVGVGREDSGDANNLLLQLLDNESLTGSRDETEEFSFHFGFSQNSDTDPGPGEVLQGYDDTILAGDFSGVGFDQIVTVRTTPGGDLQFLGDTDRDSTNEYLFRFKDGDFTPLIADMNGDGIDDAVVVDTSTTSNSLEWYIHYGVPGATPFPTDNSIVSTDATFSFGVDADHLDAGAGFADM